MDYATAVEDAVKRFYATGSNDVHTWVLQVQASVEAWTFVWQLLDPSKSCEVQAFAASTLHMKISRQWKEIPENEYATLQAKILDCMKSPNTSKIVLSKLCQSLALFIANTNTVEAKEKKSGVIDQVIEMLPYDSPQTLDLLLRVLAAIPGEFERLRATKFRESLVRCWGKMAALLRQFFQMYERCAPESNEETLHLLSLECALAWLKLGQLPLDDTAQIYPHFLIAAAKYAPREPEELDSRGWEVTQDCLMMAVTHAELYKRPLLLWEWSKGLVSLARQHSGSVFCGPLTSLGEANSRLFLLGLTEDTDETRRWTSETLIELLLECSEHKGRYPIDETRSCIPFGFWYVLQDDITFMDQPLETRARNALKPIYARLAQALLRKATLPSSPDEAGNVEERELLRCYRQDAADTLMHCHSVLGKDLFVLLGQRLSNLQVEPQKWTDVESTLHALNAISLATIQEDEYVAAIIDLMVSHIPYGQYPDEVLACACSAVSAYVEWISEHPDPWLERVLQLVGHGLSVSSITSTPASLALKDIARECAPHLAPLAPSILETIEGTLRNIPPGSDEAMRLMFAAGKLLNSLASVEEQMSHLDATLGPGVRRLHELLGFDTSVVQPAYAEVARQLKMITTFFTALEGHIGKTVLDGLIPIFVQIISHPDWNKDDTTLEAMYTCAQRSLQSLSNPETDARPLFNILTTSYKIHPHPSAINLLRQLVLLFRKDPENIATPVFAEISAHTLGGVAACRSVGGDLSDLSDLLEAYLMLLTQISKSTDGMLVKVADQVPEMLRCGMVCLTLPEMGTAKAAGSFLNHAIWYMVSQPYYLERFIHPIGQQIVCVILQYVASGFSRSNFDPYGEVLSALIKYCPGWTRQWLRLALSDSTAPPVPEAQKERLVQSVYRSPINRASVANALKDFCLQCRRVDVSL